MMLAPFVFAIRSIQSAAPAASVECLGDVAVRPPAIVEAVAALGGSAVLCRPRWLAAGVGSENTSAEAQGVWPDRPTWRPHEETIAVTAQRVAWERRTPRNDLSLRWRRFITGSDSSGVIDWVGGFGRMRADQSSESTLRATARRLPHLLLRELARDELTLVRTEARAREDRLEVRTAERIQLKVSIGRRPRVLLGVEYRTWLPGRGMVSVAWRWVGWRRDRELGWVPRGHTVSIDGVPFQRVDYTRYGPFDEAADSLVHLPGSIAARVPEPDGPVLRSVEGLDLGSRGIHLIDVGGFRTLAVEFPSFLVAVEAPERHPGFETIPASAVDSLGSVGPLLAARLDSLAHGRPLRYLVVSHHHDDHVGGLPSIARTGLTVLTAPSHRATARHSASLLGQGDGTAVVAVRERRVISEGARRLEIINVGANPHTGENLLVWLAEERLLFQGDLFYFEDGDRFPPSGRGTMNRFLAGWLTRHGISPAAIAGVHSRGIAGPDAVSAAGRLNR